MATGLATGWHVLAWEVAARDVGRTQRAMLGSPCAHPPAPGPKGRRLEFGAHQRAHRGLAEPVGFPNRIEWCAILPRHLNDARALCGAKGGGVFGVTPHARRHPGGRCGLVAGGSAPRPHASSRSRLPAMKHAQVLSYLGVAMRELVAPGVGSLAASLVQHLQGHGQALDQALAEVHDRTWLAIEAGLAGPAFWRDALAGGDARRVAQDVLAFVQSHPLAASDGDRRRLLSALRAARRAGILELEVHTGPPGALARRVAEAADAEATLAESAVALSEALPIAARDIAALVSSPGASGRPLLVEIYRTFLVLRLAGDARLARALTFLRLEELTREVPESLRRLHGTLDRHGAMLDRLTDEALAGLERLEGSVDGVADKVDALAAEVRAALARNRLDSEVRPQFTFSIRTDIERRAVLALLERFRALPPEDQGRVPELLNDLGKLQLGAGMVGEAEGSFRTAAEGLADATARAEAHHNAYRAALERAAWDRALQELAHAAALDPGRFSPFPMERYQPQRILGAGGFGTVFLATDRYLASDVVIKALHDDGVVSEPQRVFGEAQILIGLHHPSIVHIRHCDFAGPERRRAFLVMDYFAGESLEGWLARRGTLALADAVTVARQIAEGVRAAHARGILHRDLKPDNVLVRRGEDGCWEVRLIDFGLAVRQRDELAASGQSLLGSSVAGTLDYAAPEQLGRLAGVSVGPRADIYGFGKTLAQMLFRRTEPRRKHLAAIPPGLADLVESCIEQDPNERPESFDAVIASLDEVGTHLDQLDAAEASAGAPDPHAGEPAFDGVAAGAQSGDAGAGADGEETPTVRLDATGRRLAEAIGIESLGGVFSRMFEAGTELPCRHEEVYSTAEDDQTGVDVRLYQGSADRVSDCQRLGQFTLRDVPPAPKGVPQIQVVVDIDASGHIHAQAKELASGRRIRVRMQVGRTEEVAMATEDPPASADAPTTPHATADGRSRARVSVATAQGRLAGAIGLETLGGVFTELLADGVPLPAKHVMEFSTATDDQRAVTLVILQGGAERADQNTRLGKFDLSGIPEAPRGTPRINVCAEIDTDGVLTLHATELASDTALEVANEPPADPIEQTRDTAAQRAGIGDASAQQAEQGSSPAAKSSHGFFNLKPATQAMTITWAEVFEGGEREIVANEADARLSEIFGEIFGSSADRRRLRVKLPPGLATGDTIRLAKQGRNGGDLHVRISVQDTGPFRRIKDTRDVELTLPLSTRQARSGGRFLLAHPSRGRLELLVPPAIKRGQRVRLRGCGLRARDGDERGDLYVVVDVAERDDTPEDYLAGGH